MRGEHSATQFLALRDWYDIRTNHETKACTPAQSARPDRDVLSLLDVLCECPSGPFGQTCRTAGASKAARLPRGLEEAGAGTSAGLSTCRRGGSQSRRRYLLEDDLDGPGLRDRGGQTARAGGGGEGHEIRRWAYSSRTRSVRDRPGSLWPRVRPLLRRLDRQATRTVSPVCERDG